MGEKFNSNSRDWHEFPCAMGDSDAYIFVNTGIAETIQFAPTDFAKIRLSYRFSLENLVLSFSDATFLRDIESKIHDFSKANSDWFVGTLVAGDFAYFYVYTSINEEAWLEFLNILSTDSGCEFGIMLRDDPDHKGYHDELYPSEDDWQVIRDIRVIQELANRGDDGSSIRMINHWVFFKSESSSLKFGDWSISSTNSVRWTN